MQAHRARCRQNLPGEFLEKDSQIWLPFFPNVQRLNLEEQNRYCRAQTHFLKRNTVDS